jgi:hypothetical protein
MSRYFCWTLSISCDRAPIRGSFKPSVENADWLGGRCPGTGVVGVARPRPSRQAFLRRRNNPCDMEDVRNLARLPAAVARSPFLAISISHLLARA